MVTCSDCGRTMSPSDLSEYTDKIERLERRLRALRQLSAAYVAKVNKGGLPIGSVEETNLKRELASR